MRKTWLLIVVLALAASSAQAQMMSSGAATSMKLKVGDTAPDFTVKYFDGTRVKDISLRDFRGKKNVVLAFFVFAFTGG